MNSNSSGFKMYGLVRDARGEPVIDDYETCPDEIKAMLTDKEREAFENGSNTSNSNP